MSFQGATELCQSFQKYRSGSAGLAAPQPAVRGPPSMAVPLWRRSSQAAPGLSVTRRAPPPRHPAGLLPRRGCAPGAVPGRGAERGRCCGGPRCSPAPWALAAAAAAARPAAGRAVPPSRGPPRGCRRAAPGSGPPPWCRRAPAGCAGPVSGAAALGRVGPRDGRAGAAALGAAGPDGVGFLGISP